MKSCYRYLFFFLYIIGTVGIFLVFLSINHVWTEILTDLSFWMVIVLYVITIEEIYIWAKNGKRSEMSDIIAIAFFFFLIFFFTKDLLTAIMGAFSIYLWVGVYELKDYPILNKILIISLITYNFIFLAGILSFYLKNPFFLNTAFSFSFWVILGLGLIIFGRKYIVVWRFMSPEYLILFLYIISWLAISFIDLYTPINFFYGSPLNYPQLNLSFFLLNIYFILILVNLGVYIISGPILDKMLGIIKVKNEKILKLVDQVKKDIGIKGKVKVGWGKYPILNAMAYGSFIDKRIAIIAENIIDIPDDELKGIMAHELAHAKGKHTLILTFISIADLIFRMLVGIPATYYDYTFGNPQMPMILFIILNISIYFFLYIIVRVLEGKADLKAKESGYDEQLVKALYNLESFYATGREIGLNTMLLCDEQITREHKIIDYTNTAEFLSNSMIKPSRLSLLSNFLNSHPPTYHRITSILGNDLKPGKEALLPFICMTRSNQVKYAKKFMNARDSYKKIINQKFKELFEIDDISSFFNDIDRKSIFEFQVNKDYLFNNKLTEEFYVGKLLKIDFYDDISEPFQYNIKNLQTGKMETLNSSLFSKRSLVLGGIYFFKNDLPLILKEIEFNDDKKDGYFIFTDGKNNERITKPIKKTRLPLSIDYINNLEDKILFLKFKGHVRIVKCTKIKPSNLLGHYELELIQLSNDESQDKMYLTMNELIIHPQHIYLSISRKFEYRKSELEVLNWILNSKAKCTIWLKKPVNNYEIGYIQNINVSFEKLNVSKDEEQLGNDDNLKFKNIFGKILDIPYKSIEQISFEHDGAMIQKKKNTSFISRLGYKISKKYYPQRIIMT